MSLYATPADKISVLLSGVSERFRPVNDDAQFTAVRQKYNIGTQPYIFTVGTVQPRKNYPRLVEAIAQLRSQGADISLVIAGGKGWLEDSLYEALDIHHMRDHVHLIGYADDADLSTLYSAAVCSAFVSLYEGFGLPVLEAMACGCPVVTSNVSSMPEVAGDAAPIVDPTSVEAITETLHRLIYDESYRDQCRKRGFTQASRFTWVAAANRLLDIYDKLLGEPKP